MFFMFVCILLDLVSIGFLDRLGFEAADIYNRFFREVFFCLLLKRQVTLRNRLRVETHVVNVVLLMRQRCAQL